MAGITVGVALILVLLSLVAGTNAEVGNSVRSLGASDIIVYNGTAWGQNWFFNPATLDRSLVTVISNMPHVYRAYVPFYRWGTITSIIVKADSPNNVASVQAAIRDLFPGLSVVTPSSIISQTSDLVNTLTLFFATIGVVALVAGSFGVINTMLISVFERTREIGTMKAIGAKQTTVLKMFIYEALIIGCLGGLIGLAVGGLAAFAMSELPQPLMASLSPALTPENLILSFVLGFATGTLAGLYPAWRASRMKIVEALRNV